VDLVNEDDDVLVLFQLGQDPFESLFELPPILGPSHDQRQIERHDATVRERKRHAALDRSLRQALDDRRLAHARFTEKDRVVLRSPRQDLDDSIELALAPHEGIERPLRGQ